MWIYLSMGRHSSTNLLSAHTDLQAFISVIDKNNDIFREKRITKTAISRFQSVYCRVWARIKSLQSFRNGNLVSLCGYCGVVPMKPSFYLPLFSQEKKEKQTYLRSLFLLLLLLLDLCESIFLQDFFDVFCTTGFFFFFFARVRSRSLFQ